MSILTSLMEMAKIVAGSEEEKAAARASVRAEVRQAEDDFDKAQDRLTEAWWAQKHLETILGVAPAAAGVVKEDVIEEARRIRKLLPSRRRPWRRLLSRTC